MKVAGLKKYYQYKILASLLIIILKGLHPVCAQIDTIQKNIDTSYVKYLNKLNPIKDNSTIKIHGKVTSEMGTSNQKLQYQNTPTDYFRTIIEPEVELFGLKFNSNALITTEDLVNGRSINMFNISFDRENLIDRISKIKLNSKTNNRVDSLIQLKDKKAIELYQFKQKINNPSYKTEFDKAKEIKARALLDSNYAKKRAFKVKRSDELINKHKFESAEMDSLQNKVVAIDQQIRYLNTLSNLSIDDPRNLGDYSSIEINKKNKTKLNGYLNAPDLNDTIQNVNTKLKSKIPLTYKIFKSVRRLDLFDVYPNYSPLILNGISLRGVNIELNPKYVYVGAATGYVNTGNWSLNNLHDQKYISVLRGGLGNLDKNYVGLVYLYGTDNSIDSNSKHQITNRVIGFQARYILLENHTLDMEWAWSNVYNISSLTQTFNELASTVNQNNFNSSNYIKYKGDIIQTGTKLNALFRSDELFYYSLGNPFNRKDCRRIEGGIEQKLYKRKLVLTGLYRYEMDNLSELKGVTSTTHTREIGMSYRQKGTQYKVAYMNVNTFNSNLGELLRLHNINLNYNTTFKIRKKSNTIIASYGYLNSFSVMNQKNAVMHYATLSNMYSITPNLISSTMFSANLKEIGGDSSNSYILSTGLNYLNKKYTVGVKYGFQNISKIECRNIVEFNTSYQLTSMFMIACLGSYQFINSLENKVDYYSLQIRTLIRF
jgi:hypothetical protein